MGEPRASPHEWIGFGGRLVEKESKHAVWSNDTNLEWGCAWRGVMAVASEWKQVNPSNVEDHTSPEMTITLWGKNECVPRD